MANITEAKPTQMTVEEARAAFAVPVEPGDALTIRTLHERLGEPGNYRRSPVADETIRDVSAIMRQAFPDYNAAEMRTLRLQRQDEVERLRIELRDKARRDAQLGIL